MLFQGYSNEKMKGAHTLHFMHWTKRIQTNGTTYSSMFCDIRLHEAEWHERLIIVDSDRLHCTGNAATPTDSTTAMNAHPNSETSTDRS